MPQETVFYFDVLGFRQMVSAASGDAVDALSALAAQLRQENLFPEGKKWSRRYALGDSVFLTHGDPTVAIQQAGDLVFNLFQQNLRHGAAPFFVRGALAYGEVQHLRGIFLTTPEPANLVGPAVVEAVMLEQVSGIKGPRILVGESLSRSMEGSLREWLLRPTSVPGVWEVLWLLPSIQSLLPTYEDPLSDICSMALSLLANGGHPTSGVHYREFALLAARSIERICRFAQQGRVEVSRPCGTYLPGAEVRRVCETTSGLPDEYVSSLVRLVDSLNMPS